MTPRGIRNNNPGNIERGINWQGLAKPHEMTPEQKAEDRFAVFRSPEWGIRAMVRILQTYRTKYGLTTIAGIIDRWAPPGENDSHSYAAAVAREVGVAPDGRIDTADPNTLVKLVGAMIRHENGQQPYSEAVIRSGIALADIGPAAEPAPKPVSKSKRVAGAATTAGVSGAATVLVTANDLLTQSQDFVARFFNLDTGDWPGLAIVFGVALAAFLTYIGWTVWVDYRDKREPEEIA